jgi:CIC family chloride channel protein
MYEVTLRRTREEKERLRLAATQMRELVKPADTVVPLTANVKDMTRVFLEYPVKYLYVTDDAGRFRGAVALKDITSDLLDKRDTTDKTAAHYVHTPFPLLTPDMPLATALERFMAFKGERLPVIESEAEPTLAGVVYKTSLLDAYRRMTGER